MTVAQSPLEDLKRKISALCSSDVSKSLQVLLQFLVSPMARAQEQPESQIRQAVIRRREKIGEVIVAKTYMYSYTY